MEEDFISVELANKISEIGFNEQTNKLYWIPKETNKPEIIDYYDEGYYDVELEEATKIWCPTQTFLAKWYQFNF